MFNFGFLKFIAVLWPFALVAFIFWLIAKDRKKRYEIDSDLYHKANETGEVPPIITVVKAPRKTNLGKGIILISIGVGIFLCCLFIGILSKMLLAVETIIGMSVGIIPVTIGIGYLLIHFLERKKNDRYQKNEK
jgi:hypothetical protein